MQTRGSVGAAGLDRLAFCVLFPGFSGRSPAGIKRSAWPGNPQAAGDPSSGRDTLSVVLKPENGASVALPVQAKGGWWGGIISRKRGAAGTEKRAGLFHGDPLSDPLESRRDVVAVQPRLQQQPPVAALFHLNVRVSHAMTQHQCGETGKNPPQCSGMVF